MIAPWRHGLRIRCPTRRRGGDEAKRKRGGCARNELSRELSRYTKKGASEEPWQGAPCAPRQHPAEVQPCGA